MENQATSDNPKYRIYYYKAYVKSNLVNEAKFAFTDLESAPPLSLRVLPGLDRYCSPVLPVISQSPPAPHFLLLVPALSETKQTKES